jgi:hypothetical protein
MVNNQINLSFLQEFAQECESYKAAQIAAENARYEFTVAEYKYQNGYIGYQEFSRVRMHWHSSVDKMRQMLMTNKHSVSIQY